MTIISEYQQDMVVKIINRQRNNFLQINCDVVCIPPFSGKKMIILEYLKMTNNDSYFFEYKARYEHQFALIQAQNTNLKNFIVNYNNHIKILSRLQPHYPDLRNKYIHEITPIDISNIDTINQQFIFKTLIITHKNKVKSWKQQVKNMKMNDQVCFITKNPLSNEYIDSNIIVITTNCLGIFQNMFLSHIVFARVIFDCKDISSWQNLPMLSSSFQKICLWERMTPLPMSSFQLKDMMISLEEKDIPFKRENELLFERKTISCFSIQTIRTNIIVHNDRKFLPNVNRINNLLEYDDICAICRYDKIVVPTMLSCCGHVFCVGCTQDMSFKECPCCKASQTSFKYHILNENENDIMNSIKTIILENQSKFIVINISHICQHSFFQNLESMNINVKIAHYLNKSELKLWKKGTIKILVIDDRIEKTDLSKTSFLIHVPFQGNDLNYSFPDKKYIENLINCNDLNHEIQIINFIRKPDEIEPFTIPTFLPMPPLVTQPLSRSVSFTSILSLQ